MEVGQDSKEPTEAKRYESPLKQSIKKVPSQVVTNMYLSVC